jgi:hypothetical protein
MRKRYPHDGPHKYLKIPVGSKGYKVYKCILPGCNHNLPTLEMALGLTSLCHGCSGEVTFTKEMLVSQSEVTKPYCPSCRAERARRREALIAVGSSPRLPDDEQGEYA